MTARVAALHLSSDYTFSKSSSDSIDVVAGMGVVGDVHFGATVRHRSRVAADPTQPNLRQVHLIPGELFSELAANGFSVQPGDLGENVTTEGVDLYALATGTLLRIGDGVLLCVTGLRNPCGQIEGFQTGLLRQVAQPASEAEPGHNGGDGIKRSAGVMAVVVQGGTIDVGATIAVQFPPTPHAPLVRV